MVLEDVTATQLARSATGSAAARCRGRRAAAGRCTTRRVACRWPRSISRRRPRSTARSRWRGRRRHRGPTWRSGAGPRALFRLRELDRAGTPTTWRRSITERARQGAVDDAAGRGGARPRVRRVRVRDPAPAQGLAQQRGVDRHRRPHDAPAGGVVGRHHAVQLPGDGPALDAGQRGRVRQRRSCSSRPRRTRRRRSSSPSWCSEAGFPDGVVTVVQGDAEAVDALLDAPRRRRRVVRRQHADRAPRLRDRHGARQAGAGARRRRRTTWSCCPTPTSTPPPMPPSRPATARPESAAWRSRWWSRSGAVGRPARRGDRARGSPTSWSVPATTTASMMGPLITGEHRDRVRCYVDGRGRRRRRRSWSTVRRAAGLRRFLRRLLAARPRRRRAWRVYDDEIFGPVLSVVRVDTFDEALASSTPTPTATASRCSPATAARPAASSER